jgi:hypothetical protein
MNWSFRDLDLTNVEAQKGGNTLKPGRYSCEIQEVEIKKTAAGGNQLFVRFVDQSSGGYVSDYVTLTHPKSGSDPKAKMSVEIGMSRLKSILVHGGHPSPDRPGDVRSLVGLIVGVSVEQGEDWVDDKGVTRKGGGKPARNGAYFSPVGLKVDTRPPAPGTTSKGVDDDIPF